MENDRAETNLGLGAEVEDQGISKLPGRRFIGRRAAAERAVKDGKTENGNMENDGAIQGALRGWILLRNI
jgi:hypothetical protein